MQTQETQLATPVEVDDREYWENYYATRKTPFAPSLFALHTLATYLKRGDALIELGCGNGRDAIHFSQHGIRVDAVDQCARELDYLQRTHAREGLRFRAGDFTRLGDGPRYRHVYSRFTLHSVSSERQAALLKWIGATLEPGGLFHLEARGLKNELCGQGLAVPAEPNAYILDGHFRRFLDLDATCNALSLTGLGIVEAIEAPGFSPFGDQDETFMRIVARRVAEC